MFQKLFKSGICLLIGVFIFFSPYHIYAQVSNQQNSISISKTSIVIDNYEFGPAIDKVVLQMSSNVRAVNTNSTSVTTAGINRTVTNAYLSDSQGNAAQTSGRGGQYITLELSVDSYNNDDPAQSASPFSFNLSTYRNTWVSSYIVTINGLQVTTSPNYNSSQISSEQEAINNKIIPTASRFSERGTYSLPYTAYQPQAAAGGEKNPLIVWLHGIGEAGTDINFPLLSNEVNRLTEDSIQNHFTSTGTGLQRGAYVLIPQSPTPWGESQETALMDTISQYVAAHPDIDSNHIYLAGGSNGASMTVEMGVRYPDTFAALVPIAGGYSYQSTENNGETLYNLDSSTLSALKTQPMWLITAKADSTVPVDYNTLPFYKGLLNGGATNKWLTYYETVVGTELPQEYNGHWSWLYFFHDQVTGVQNTNNVVTWSGLTGMIATNPTHGGDAQANVNGISYRNVFDWMNNQ